MQNDELIKLMEKKKLSIKDLAYKMDISEIAIKKWLECKLTPRLIHAMKLKEIFGKAFKFEMILKPQDLSILKDFKV